jgi:glycosyltransferase involved in cell wall biosynthesis
MSGSRRAGRVVQPRDLAITYWTGWLSPEMEGCSKEVFALKDHFPRSRIFGLSPNYTLKLSRRQRYLGMHVRFDPLFRIVGPLLEQISDLGHIYGGMGEWFFLKVLGRRPLILTVAVVAPPLEREAYAAVSCFVVHSPATARDLVARGVQTSAIRLIYPGADLQRFQPRPRAAADPAFFPDSDPSRFRILFATTPGRAEGIAARGVDLLREAARQMPDVDFLLPWRPWAGADALIQRVTADAPPNFMVQHGLVGDMRAAYQSVDATIAPFVTASDGKICPTSLIESMACGRPLLVSTEVGIADVVAEGAGVVFAPTVDGLCGAVERLRSAPARYCTEARTIAERHFDLRHCMRQHEDLYREVVTNAC